MPILQPLTATSFGTLLRLLRQREHLTQLELANRVGYSDAQINRYEKGIRTPDSSMVAARFVQALGLEDEPELAARLVALARKPMQEIANSAAESNSQREIRTAFQIPAPATVLIGRNADIAAVLDTLNRNDVQVVTLVGPPGVGKTQLALRVAREIENLQQHDTCFVALAPISDGSLIPDALLQAMDVTSNTQDPLTQIKNILHNRAWVLVLDNFEHLLISSTADKSIGIVAELIASAPHIKVLVTSRAPLRLTNEHIYEVAPLSSVAAEALFVTRVLAIRPSFQLRPQDEQAIADICQRLDYLPLAIELAAARIRLFDPQALLQRLLSPLAFLTSGSRDLPHRQRTLRNAIDWSYNLLTPDEQVLFRRLSSIADGFNMSLIEAIAGSDLQTPVVDLVQSLVDKSILHVEHIYNSTRFRMLEMLREYATELLIKSGEAEAIAKVTARWFVDQVQWMQDDPALSETVDWFDWFDTEYNNVRAIILWAIQSNHIVYGMQLVAKLGLTWRLHGPLRNGWQLTLQLLEHPCVREQTHLYAQVLLAVAHVAEEIGGATISEQYLIEALNIFRPMGDKRFTAMALTHMGDHAVTRSDFASARLLFDESIVTFRQVGYKRGLALALNWSGAMERELGNYERALLLYDEAIQIAQEIQSVGMSYMAAGWKSFVYGAMGDFDKAKLFAERAYEICKANKITSSARLMESVLGNIMVYQGDSKSAVRYLQQTARHYEEQGSPDMRSQILISLGWATHLNGDTAQAEAILHEAILLLWEYQRLAWMPDTLIRLAWIAIDRQDLPRAVRLFGAVETITAQNLVRIPDSNQKFHRPRLQAARTGLSQADFELFWREGQAMDYKAVVDYVVEG